jgi:hypothetical protein
MLRIPSAFVLSHSLHDIIHDASNLSSVPFSCRSGRGLDIILRFGFACICSCAIYKQKLGFTLAFQKVLGKCIQSLLLVS